MTLYVESNTHSPLYGWKGFPVTTTNVQTQTKNTIVLETVLVIMLTVMLDNYLKVSLFWMFFEFCFQCICSTWGLNNWTSRISLSERASPVQTIWYWAGLQRTNIEYTVVIWILVKKDSSTHSFSFHHFLNDVNCPTGLLLLLLTFDYIYCCQYLIY